MAAQGNDRQRLTARPLLSRAVKPFITRHTAQATPCLLLATVFMTPERWQQINQLFHSALEHVRDQRAAFLARACADDEALRAEVESLVASHEQADSFIETPASDVAAELFAGGQSRLEAGQKIGHYTIMALLGAGGMAEVYLAKDKKLDRLVAVKILNEKLIQRDAKLPRFLREAKAA